MTSSTKPFDPTKPVITRDGRKARIICTDLKMDNGDTIVALITTTSGQECLTTFKPNGQYFRFGPDKLDLVNVPEVTRILVFKAPYAVGGVVSAVLNDLGKEPGELLIARKKAEGTFLKIVEVDLDSVN